MNELAEILSTFGETADDDEERLLAMESAMAIHVRMDGSRSMKVAAGGTANTPHTMHTPNSSTTMLITTLITY